MLTYDQMSEVRIAFNEAYVPIDRRRSPRMKTWCHAAICGWDGRRAGEPIAVVVTDFSTSGVGIKHTGRLKVGSRYLLEVPRPQRTPLRVLFTVVRCSETDGGMFDVELAPEEILDVIQHADRLNALKPARPPAHLRPTLLAIALLLLALTLIASLL